MLPLMGDFLTKGFPFIIRKIVNKTQLQKFVVAAFEARLEEGFECVGTDSVYVLWCLSKCDRERVLSCIQVATKGQKNGWSRRKEVNSNTDKQNADGKDEDERVQKRDGFGEQQVI